MPELSNVLDGRTINYTDQTEFLVEVGRHESAYKVRYSFTGNLAQAVRYYNCINIGNGYKKRLRAPSLKPRVLAREFADDCKGRARYW